MDDKSEIRYSKSEIKHPVPAVGAFIIQDEKILLVKRGSKPAIGKWSIPGGSIEWGESMEEAVKREVLEETGLVVEVGEFAGVTDLIVKEDGEITFHYVLLNFFATVVSGDICAATDAVDCRWTPLSELKDIDLTSTVRVRLEELGIVGNGENG